VISKLLAPQGTASVILPQQSLASFTQQLNAYGLFVAKQLDIISIEGKLANRSILAIQHHLAVTEQPILTAPPVETQYQQMTIRDKQGRYSETMIDLCRPFYLKL